MRVGLSHDERIPWIWKLENKLEWKRAVTTTAQKISRSRMDVEAHLPFRTVGVGMGLGG